MENLNSIDKIRVTRDAEGNPTGWKPPVSKEILSYADRWQRIMDLSHFLIKHEFVNEVSEENPETIAEATTQWQYRESTITWYLPNARELESDALEDTVVHELVHVALAPIQDFVPNKHEKLSEYVTEGIARALLSASRGYDGNNGL